METNHLQELVKLAEQKMNIGDFNGAKDIANKISASAIVSFFIGFSSFIIISLNSVSNLIKEELKIILFLGCKNILCPK